MLRPKPDLDEAVMNELEYLHAYARQNGEAAAWRNAADEIVKLRCYADETKARLAEVEAQAAAMREVLEEALPAEGSGWWCPTCRREVPDLEVTFEERHEACGTYIGTVNSKEWHRRARAAIASDASHKTAERLRLLEELAEAATAFVEYCTLVECLPRTEDAICEQEPCLKQRLKAAVKALSCQGPGEGRG